MNNKQTLKIRYVQRDLEQKEKHEKYAKRYSSQTKKSNTIGASRSNRLGIILRMDTCDDEEIKTAADDSQTRR